MDRVKPDIVWNLAGYRVLGHLHNFPCLQKPIDAKALMRGIRERFPGRPQA